MTLQHAERLSLVERVIDQLRTQITAGSWECGERIPTEPQLSDMLGVGRNTVREAVRALVHTGLLEVRQGAGTFVRSNRDPSSCSKAWTMPRCTISWKSVGLWRSKRRDSPRHVVPMTT